MRKGIARRKGCVGTYSEQSSGENCFKPYVQTLIALQGFEFNKAANFRKKELLVICGVRFDVAFQVSLSRLEVCVCVMILTNYGLRFADQPDGLFRNQY